MKNCYFIVEKLFLVQNVATLLAKKLIYPAFKIKFCYVFCCFGQHIAILTEIC